MGDDKMKRFLVSNLNRFIIQILVGLDLSLEHF